MKCVLRLEIGLEHSRRPFLVLGTLEYPERWKDGCEDDEGSVDFCDYGVSFRGTDVTPKLFCPLSMDVTPIYRRYFPPRPIPIIYGSRNQGELEGNLY